MSARILPLLRAGFLVPHVGHLARAALPSRELPQGLQDGARGGGLGAHTKRPASGSQEEDQLDQAHTSTTVKLLSDTAVSFTLLIFVIFLHRVGTDLSCIRYITRS